MDRKETIKMWREQTGVGCDVAAFNVQRTLWSKYLECRIYTTDNRVFSALYDDECGQFTAEFQEIKKPEEGK